MPLGHSFGQQLLVFAIAYLGDTWIVTEDSDQRHVDAVEWPEPKSVRIIPGLRQIAAPLTSML